MGKACVYRPTNNKKNNPELFDEINKNLIKSSTFTKFTPKEIYNTTWSLYGLANSDFFKQRHPEIHYDEKGFPSYKSLITSIEAEALLGDAVNNVLSGSFKVRSNTRDNYRVTLNDITEFNKSQSKKTAYITTGKGNTLKVTVENRNLDNNRIFKEQVATQVLNDRISTILSDVGITIGDIEETEAKYRNGITDFSVASLILTGVDSLIRVANNKEGVQALSEEFAHLLIGVRRKTPLIDRIINNLSNNEEAIKLILGDEYEAVVTSQNNDMKLVAEEALGRVLQYHLIDNVTKEVFGESSNSTLFTRLRSFILNKFKSKSEKDVADIIQEVDKVTSDIANRVLSGTDVLTKESIYNSKREAKFNSLKEQIERNIKVINKAIITEKKRQTITRDKEKANDIFEILHVLEAGKQPSADSTLVIFKYLKYALDELHTQQEALYTLYKMTMKEKFKTLRRVRSYLQSFSPIIKLLYEIRSANKEDTSDEFDRVFNYNGEDVNLFQVIEELNGLVNTLEGHYRRVVVPTFAEFLKPFVGEIRNRSGKVVGIEDMLMSQQGDISMLDRWVDCMADSSDQFLQSMDSVYRAQKDKARLKSIKDIRRIQALQIRAERAGITDYEWMFEHYRDGHKTGNYIDYYNLAQFYRDLKEENDRLDKKYGKIPESAEDKEAKIAEKKEWLNGHATLNRFGEWSPNASYINSEYTKLSKEKKEFLKEYKKLIEEFSTPFPPNKSGVTAIQLRRDSLQRLLDTKGSPSEIIKNIREAWNATFKNQSDDDQLYGNRSLVGFDNRPWNLLPVYYRNKLSNPDELSTDVFKALTAYAISSNDYAAVDDVLDALEVGRTIMTDDIREVKELHNNKNITERLGRGVNSIERVVTKRNQTTLIAAKLEDWFDSVVYKKLWKDDGELSIPLINKKVSKTKLAKLAMSAASACQLGFNWFANTANVVTGIAAINIEAANGQFFSIGDLAKADSIYSKLMLPYVSQLGTRYKTNKLALFDELLNVKYNFDTRKYQSTRKSLLSRMLLGTSLKYLGQEGGDHWLYNRVAIAMALKEKVRIPSENGYKEVRLWDALEVVDSDAGEGLKEMRVKKGTQTIDGKDYDIGKFSRKVGDVSRNLFGAYNEEDRAMAQRYILGNFLLQYRKWIKPMFNRRFQKKQWNQTLGRSEEGYYRAGLRILSELTTSKIGIVAAWDSLDKKDKKILFTIFTEVAQLLTVIMLANFIPWPDDEDRPWSIKAAEYICRREVHELGNLVPSPIMAREIGNTIKSPMAILGIMNDISSLAYNAFDPNSWTEVKESGPWKGYTEMEKSVLKLPIPVVKWYQQIDKFTGDMDDKIDYYARTQN